MKNSRLAFLALGFTLLLSGCGSPPAPTQPLVTTPPTPPVETWTREYVTSSQPEKALDYCQEVGDQWGRENYSKTFTVKHTMAVSSPDPMVALPEMIKAISGCKAEAMQLFDMKIENRTAYLAQWDGWAGVSIHDCECQPGIEQSLLLQPEIDKVEWILASQWQEKFGPDKLLLEKAGTLHISYQGNLYKFSGTTAVPEGETEALFFLDRTEALASAIYYRGIEIGTIFAGPYGIYTNNDLQKATFTCDGSFHSYSATNKPLVSTGCTTNGKDTLTQYEFTAASTYPLTTGGEAFELWRMITMKKVGDRNFIFLTDLCTAASGSATIPCLAEPAPAKDPNYATASSTKTLDALLKLPSVKQAISKAKTVSDSFLLE